MSAKRGPGARTHRAFAKLLRRNHNPNTLRIQVKTRRFQPPAWCGTMQRYLDGEVDCGIPAFSAAIAFHKACFSQEVAP